MKWGQMIVNWTMMLRLIQGTTCTLLGKRHRPEPEFSPRAFTSDQIQGDQHEQNQDGQDGIRDGRRAVIFVFRLPLVLREQGRGCFRGTLGTIDPELWNSCLRKEVP